MSESAYVWRGLGMTRDYEHERIFQSESHARQYLKVLGGKVSKIDKGSGKTLEVWGKDDEPL